MLSSNVLPGRRRNWRARENIITNMNFYYILLVPEEDSLPVCVAWVVRSGLGSQFNMRRICYGCSEWKIVGPAQGLATHIDSHRCDELGRFFFVLTKMRGKWECEKKSSFWTKEKAAVENVEGRAPIMEWWHKRPPSQFIDRKRRETTTSVCVEREKRRRDKEWSLRGENEESKARKTWMGKLV